MITLKERVSKLVREHLEEFYIRELEDWAEMDTEVRRLAKQVLSDIEVEGDSYGVPGIEDIVELLVKRIRHDAP